ncbi:extracellular small neutral protease [Pilimelia anulata]|uniref:Extracellular small neutral protease n=1 Tax=Pilimelia anulata TaxID=53371 RepID=A0A8J3F7H1_9ACTN|nr:snapalysin family zinc-dependent metalloprotease [Pilimelia anulata]GGJ76664.1 extracellular small neutral protease [Pilimelia anulata]
MRAVKTAITTALGLGLVGFVATSLPAQAAVPTPTATYTEAERAANNEASFQLVLKEALEHYRATGRARTLTYDASRARSFAQQISRSTEIWNAAVRNVQLAPSNGQRADFTYTEGNFQQGSYVQGNKVHLDFKQNQQYDSVRVTTHETGHILGLPDNYRGPCSELMSGGGPGPSCTNSQPNAQERQRVEQRWGRG